MDNISASTNGSSANLKPKSGLTRKQKSALIVSAIAATASVLLLLYGAYILTLPSTDTAKWRDLFIIFFTTEVFILGTSLLILVFQLTKLVNLIQNEVQPVLEAATETINTVRGTAEFLSNNLVRPVIKVNSYIASIKQMLGLFNTGK